MWDPELVGDMLPQEGRTRLVSIAGNKVCTVGFHSVLTHLLWLVFTRCYGPLVCLLVSVKPQSLKVSYLYHVYQTVQLISYNTSPYNAFK